jgi:hypothetical protein
LHEVHDLCGEPLLFKDIKENIVVDGWEKMSKVKSDHTGFEVVGPP